MGNTYLTLKYNLENKVAKKTTVAPKLKIKRTNSLQWVFEPLEALPEQQSPKVYPFFLRTT